jgi:predicted nucleic acid-binding Zn ribbon protein
MPEDKEQDDQLTERQKQLYRKTRVPHKFCPYCGHRNEADAQECANCGKDISWMRVPEPIPIQEPPRQKPRSMPEQQKVFTARAVIVFILILLLVLALILILVFTTTKKSKGKAIELRIVPAFSLSSPPGTVAGALLPGALRSGPAPPAA